MPTELTGFYLGGLNYLHGHIFTPRRDTRSVGRMPLIGEIKDWEEAAYFVISEKTVADPPRFYPYFQHSSQLAWATVRQIAISEMFSPVEDSDVRSYTVPLSEVFRDTAEEIKGVTVDLEVMAGAPCIRGTRIPVYAVLDAVAQNGTFDAALRAYPGLTIEQVRDAVTFGKLVVECPVAD